MMPYYGGTMCKNYLHLCSHLYRTNFRVWNCFHLAFLCHSFPLFHSWSQALVLYFRGASKTWLQEPNYLQHWWLIIIYNYHHHLIFLVCMIKEMRTATLSRLLNSFMYHLFILFLSTTHICSRWCHLPLQPNCSDTSHTHRLLFLFPSYYDYLNSATCLNWNHSHVILNTLPDEATGPLCCKMMTLPFCSYVLSTSLAFPSCIFSWSPHRWCYTSRN
jgi:hypothetical protein